LRGEKRWCIWCDESGYKELNEINFFNNRFKLVARNRNNSRKIGTQKYSKLLIDLLRLEKNLQML
jgi:hypothetical protein